MNPQELIQLIQRDTGLAAQKSNMLLDGWDNLVLEVNNELIFRFTRRPEILEQHLKELELLPLLNKHLTLQVPEPIYHQTDSPPYYTGYKKIPGKPITKETNQETIIHTLTEFLRELQQIDHNSLQKTPRFTPNSWKKEYHELYQRITKEAYPSLGPQIQSRITKEFNAFLETKLQFKPTICHRDLGIEHILESGNRITGIIDWGDACIGDPAFDLTGIFMGLGEDIARSISNQIGCPIEYLERARFYSKIAPFYEYLYGKEINEKNHIDAGLRKIKKTWSKQT